MAGLAGIGAGLAHLARAFGILLATAGLSLAQSAMTHVDVPSTTLGHPLPVMVYTPDGKAPVGGWPVLYLLHGRDGDERSWQQMGDIQATLDRLIGAGSIRPVLVVMPGVGNSWYVNSASIGGAGDYDTALTADLRSWVETNLPARRDPGGRAIAGLSMGGYGALHIAYGHPADFSSVASLSGAIWNNVPADDLEKSPDELTLLSDAAFYHRVDLFTVEAGPILLSSGNHFFGAFGTPFSARRFNDQNIFTLVQKAVAANTILPATYLTVGDDDGFHFWRGAIGLFETLLADGRSPELRITDGNHVWSVWKLSIVDALAFIDAHWGPVPTAP